MAAHAKTGATTTKATSATSPPPPAMLHVNMAEILPSLPLEVRCPPFHLSHYNGFWQPEAWLGNIPALHARFEPGPKDIFLASFPKAGTTWLKALAFATLNRAMHSPFATDHPLCRRNPHDCVRFLEVSAENKINVETPEVLSSAAMFATHLPYSMLPERITGEGSRSRVVYICREPKDVLVSGWLFSKNTSAAAFGVDVQSYTLQEAFDLFCEGRCTNGPYWLHVLEYWEESLRRPDKVLFLKYEDMLLEPVSILRKLAAFMGCAFSKEEEDGGVIDAIVELCSLRKLKSMEVNKSGCNRVVRNEAFFRKGVVGDWSNHLTTEMAKRLDNIVDDALHGSGLIFANCL